MNKKQILLIVSIVIFLIAAGAAVMKLMGGKQDPLNYSLFQKLTVTSNAFENNGDIPVQYTGRGKDISPDLKLSEISVNGKSVAVIMDDLDAPVGGLFNHWVIWNLPVQKLIPENIPHGEIVEGLGNAVQGTGWGKNMYRGPKPPFGTHRYKFNVYVLDCRLDLGSDAGKNELLEAMNGHVLQYGSITGKSK